MKVSIIIPAHNEERRIEKNLSDYSEFYENMRKGHILDYEILVVINASNDKTLEIVKKINKKNPRVVYLDLEKGGKGYAVIEGFKDALKRDNYLIGFVDADGATSPEAFYDLIKKINGYGGAIASRYLRGARVHPKPSISRIIVSRIFNALIRAVMFVPYRDTQCGAKLFSSEALKKTLPKLTFTKWAFDVDLLYNIRKQGHTILEVPTAWADKEYSKINFMKSGPWMALAVIRLRLLNSPFKSFMKIYDKLIYKIWRLK